MGVRSFVENKILFAQLASLAFLVVASLTLTWSLTTFAQDVRTLKIFQHQLKMSYRKGPLDSFSFVGSDHPRSLPIEEKFVKMVAQESNHYSILLPESEAEWVWTSTLGDGHVRLGSSQRMFAVSMFHQLHCLRSFRSIIKQGWDSVSEARKRHMLHCFNYLRQWTLCSADVTLEKEVYGGDLAKRNFTKERAGAVHTCIDWRPAYEMMDKKWEEWEEWRVAHGIETLEDKGQ